MLVQCNHANSYILFSLSYLIPSKLGCWFRGLFIFFIMLILNSLENLYCISFVFKLIVLNRLQEGHVESFYIQFAVSRIKESTDISTIMPAEHQPMWMQLRICQEVKWDRIERRELLHGSTKDIIWLLSSTP